MAEILKKRWFQLVAVLVFIGVFVVVMKFVSREPVKEAPEIAFEVKYSEKKPPIQITNLQMQAAMNRRKMRLVATQGRISAADNENIMLYVYKSMLNDTLLTIFAKEEGVIVTPEDLEQKRQELLKRLETKTPPGAPGTAQKPELTPSQKLQYLWSTLGFRSEEEFLEDVKKEILEEKLSRHLFPENSYTVSDQDINDYIPRVAIQQIVLTFNKDKPATAEINFADRKVWDRARKIYEQLKSGADFTEMAKKYSQEEFAANGGFLGYVNKRSVVDEFWRVASGMNKGEISEPFETQFGIHILKCLDRREPDDPAFSNLRKITKKLILIRKRKADFVGWFYRRQRELEENNMIVLYNPVLKANKLRNMGKFDEAIEEYRKAIELDKETAPYYHIDIAMIYTYKRQYTESLRELRIATEIAPTDPMLYYSLGVAYMEVGEHDKALGEFKKASDNSKLNYSLHAQLEKIYTQLGLLEEADHEHDLYIKAIEILGGGQPGASSVGSMFKSQEYRMPGTIGETPQSVRPQ